MELPQFVKDAFDFTEQPLRRIDGITVVIPVRGRNDSLLMNLEYIFMQNVEPLEVIVVEESGERSIDLGKYKDRVKYIHILGGKLFNKAKCINAGVMKASYNIINMNDVDMLMPMNYLWTYSQRMKFYDMCYLSKDIYWLSNVPKAKGDFDWGGDKWTNGRKWDYAGGNFCIKKDKFISIGGMDEQFEGYGGEDGDFYVRAGRLLQLDRKRDLAFPLIHMYHLSNTENKDKNNEIFAKTKMENLRSRILYLKYSLLKTLK